MSMLNLEQSSDDLESICLSAIGVVDLSIIMDHKTILAIDARSLLQNDARLGTC